MKTKRIALFSFLLVFVQLMIAQESAVLSNYTTLLKNESIKTKIIESSFSKNTTINPFEKESAIASLSVSGKVKLNSPKSFVRIIFTDISGNEYLVYETYYVINDTTAFDIQNEFEETGVLANISPASLEIKMNDASIELTNMSYSNDFNNKALEEIKEEVVTSKQKEKFDKMNKRLEDLGMLWRAGETDISKLPYQERKQMYMYSESFPVDCYGIEYYIGGLFSSPYAAEKKPKLRSAGPVEIACDYVNEFSWSDRHGKDWNTLSRVQIGGSCVANAVTNTLESLANLYFNRKYDPNLSVAQAWFCSRRAGVTEVVADSVIAKGGLVDSVCFNTPLNYDTYDYSSGIVCDTSKCANPIEQIKSDSYFQYDTIVYGESDTIYYDTEIERVNYLKRLLMTYGPIFGKLHDWNHAMELSGFKTIQAGDILYTTSSTVIVVPSNSELIGETCWWFKAISSWGRNGVVLILPTNMRQFVGEYGKKHSLVFTGPIKSLKYNNDSIRCTDEDNDGYYFWGLGPKPAHCPPCPDEADGDDSDSSLGPMNEYGHCARLVSSSEQWSDSLSFCNDIIIQDGGLLHLVLGGRIAMSESADIVVKDGGILFLQYDAIIYNGNVHVEDGGSLVVVSDATIILNDDDNIQIDSGGYFQLMDGEIQISD